LLINAPWQNKVKSQNTLRVRLPNGDTRDSTHTSSLYIPELSQASSIAHVFPGLANHSLISVGKLCTDAVTIYNFTGKPIFEGKIDLNTGLWCIDVRHEKLQLTISVANNVYEIRNTRALVDYLHKAMFSPTKSALLQAVKNGHLITWPSLTEYANNTHLKMIPATAMGHVNQRCQNIRFTSKVSNTSDLEDETVTPAGLGTKTNVVYTVA
jgi:hypothetical protein